MNIAVTIKQLCEFLGGARDLPPDGWPLTQRGVWWGLWWGALLLAILAFCGQSSKFIYIDF